MECLATVVSQKFILVAVDSRYHIQIDNLRIESSKAKKVFGINDQNLLSIVGNPYRATDVSKFVSRMKQLKENLSFEEINADIENIFNTANTDINSDFTDIIDALPQFYEQNGNIDPKKLFEYFKDDPAKLSLAKDTILTMKGGLDAIAQILLFSWDQDVRRTIISHHISMGHSMHSSVFFEDMLPNQIYVRCLKGSKVDQELEVKLSNEFSPFVKDGWLDTDQNLSAIIKKSKEVLEEAIKHMTPFEGVPNVIFYELSHQTDFKFKHPNIELKDINYNRVR